MFLSSAQQSNRRRFWVFASTFLVLASAGLAYSYSRPAVYKSQSRVQINPGAVQVEAALATGGTQGTNAARSLLSELQVLTSRPLVQAVLDKLPARQKYSAASQAADPALAIQAGLDAQVAQGTDIVEVSLRAPDPQLAADVVNALVATYTQQLGNAYAQSADTTLEQASDEVAQLSLKVQTKRRQMEDFRLRHNIVSLEREENDILGRVKGQTEALNKAHEKLAQSESKLRAMTEAAASGRVTAASARPNATLDNLEQRASAAREELSELNRAYTPEYLAMDPRARAVRNRLAELERQISTQRQNTGQAAQSDQSSALADAREDLVAARDTVARLGQQASGNRSSLQQFASRFNEFKTMKDELAPLEALLRDATQRKARQEAGEAARRPFVRVIEPAVASPAPWAPNYARDAAFVLAGALLCALLVIGVVDLFNRVDAAPTLVVAQPFLQAYTAPNGFDALALDNRHRPGPLLAQRAPRAVETEAATPLAPSSVPRELQQEEVAAILANAAPQAALFAHLLLRGVSAQEALAVRRKDVNLTARTLHLGGAAPRDLPLDDTLEALIFSQIETAPALLEGGLAQSEMLLSIAEEKVPPPLPKKAITKAGTKAVTKAITKASPRPSFSKLDKLTSELVYAAHDAGVDQPTQVTPAALRHTFATFLARQGVRLSELARVMGQLSSDQTALYGTLLPPGKGVGLEQVDRQMQGVMAANQNLQHPSMA